MLATRPKRNQGDSTILFVSCSEHVHTFLVLDVLNAWPASVLGFGEREAMRILAVRAQSASGLILGLHK